MRRQIGIYHKSICYKQIKALNETIRREELERERREAIKDQIKKQQKAA